MKYIIIILIIAVGFLGYEIYKPEMKYFPEGDFGDKTRYYTDTAGKLICYICNKIAWLYKIDSKGRIIGNDCYREHIKNR